MKAKQKQQINKRTVGKLFKYSLVLTAVHIFVAALLIFSAWSEISREYIINWSLLIVCFLLVSALYQTMFLRRHTEINFKHTKWETIYAVTGALISAVFAGAYAFIVLGLQAPEYLVAFAASMHLSCMIFLSASSKKAMLGTSLPLVLSLVAALAYQQQTHTYVIGGALLLFTIVLLVIGFSLCNAIKQGFALEGAYKEQEALSQSYLNKINQTTIEDLDTEIFNRRFFDLTINQEVRRAKRAGTSFCMTILQMDFFDEYLANYGDKQAKKCLRLIAKTLTNATLRGGEYVTRFDDTSFAFTLPNVSADSAVAFSSKLIDLINDINIEHHYTGIKDVRKVSVSVGITEFKPGNIIDVDEIIAQSSSALLHAKSKGQNNIQVYSPMQTPLMHGKPKLVPTKSDVA